MLRIWYHGTNKENAKQIKKTGFKLGTYFAKHLEDAIGYGGEYVFGVAVNFNKVPLKWQAICSNHINKKSIVSLNKYVVKNLFKNEVLREKVFNVHIKVK